MKRVIAFFVFLFVLFVQYGAANTVDPNLMKKWKKNTYDIIENDAKTKIENKQKVFAIGALIVAGLVFAGGAGILLRMDYHKNLDTYAAIQNAKLRSMALEQLRKDREASIKHLESRLEEKEEVDTNENTEPVIESTSDGVGDVLNSSVPEEGEGGRTSIEKYLDRYGKYIVGAAVCIVAVDIVWRRIRR